MSGPRETELTRLFPCLHVFRAVGIALEPRKLLLGMIGLSLLAGGFRLFEFLPFAEYDSKPHYSYTPPEWLYLVPRSSSLEETGTVLSQPLEFGMGLLDDSASRLLLSPMVTLLEPASNLFVSGISLSMLAWNVTLLLWGLAVWSIIGGALARMTALQFARAERISISQAIRFSSRQLASCLIAPGLPLGGIGVLLIFNIVLALIASIPVVGGPFLGVLWGLILFISFLMTMMLVGIAVGWPLMVAAISTEDSDGFDGLSRSFGFLFDRPWYTLLLAAVAMLGGLMGWFLLNVLMELTVHLASWSVGTGYLGSAELHLPQAGILDFETGALSTSGFLISGWMVIFSGLLAGYGPSFFFCAVTVIYFLVRESDDGTALSQVAVYVETEKKEETQKPAESQEPAAEKPQQTEGDTPSADSANDAS